jgi:hypothetical protein
MPDTAISIKLHVAFRLGDRVFLKVDDDREVGMVTGYNVRPENLIGYYVTWGAGMESIHYEIELEKEDG